MAFTTPYEPTQPDGSDPAKDAPLDMRKKEAMMVERIESLFGTDFDDDPMEISQLGYGTNQAASIDNQLLYKNEYDAGNSGSSKTLDFVTNGPNQRLILTASCVLTIASPPAGASGVLRTIQNATGGWALTFPANWNTQANVPITVVTTALKATIYTWYSDGSVVYLGSFGTGFDVS